MEMHEVKRGQIKDNMPSKIPSSIQFLILNQTSHSAKLERNIQWNTLILSLLLTSFNVFEKSQSIIKEDTVHINRNIFNDKAT